MTNQRFAALRRPGTGRSLLLASFYAVAAVAVALGLNDVASIGLGGFVLSPILLAAQHYAFAMLRPRRGHGIALRLGWTLFYTVLTFCVLIPSYAFWWHSLDGGTNAATDLDVQTEHRLTELDRLNRAIANRRAPMESLAAFAAEQADLERLSGSACENGPPGQGGRARLLSDRAERYAAIAQRLRRDAEENSRELAVIRQSGAAAAAQAGQLGDQMHATLVDFEGEAQSLALDSARFRIGGPFPNSVRDGQLICTSAALASRLREAAIALHSIGREVGPEATEPASPGQNPLTRLAVIVGLDESRDGSPLAFRETLALAIALMIELGIVLMMLSGPLPGADSRDQPDRTTALPKRRDEDEL